MLINLCSLTSREKEIMQRLGEHHSDIILTKDNMIKLASIFQRIISDVPVIIIGETGIGKTILIRYLATLIERKVWTINVHAGLTEEQIYFAVQRALD